MAKSAFAAQILWGVRRTQLHPTGRPRASGLVAPKLDLPTNRPNRRYCPRRSVVQSVDLERRSAIAQRDFSRPELGTAALLHLGGSEQRQAPTFAGGRARELRCACGRKKVDAAGPNPVMPAHRRERRGVERRSGAKEAALACGRMAGGCARELYLTG